MNVITMDLKLAIIFFVLLWVSKTIHNNSIEDCIKKISRFAWYISIIGFCVCACKYIFLFKI